MKYRDDKPGKSAYSQSDIGCVKSHSEEQVKMPKAGGEKYSSNNVEAYKKDLARKVK